MFSNKEFVKQFVYCLLIYTGYTDYIQRIDVKY